MYDDIREFLLQIYLDYRTECIVDALDAATNVTGTAVADGAQEIIYSSTNRGLEVMAAELETFAIKSVIEAIGSFGVELDPDVIKVELLPVINDICEALYNADQYEDPHALVAICDDRDDLVECLGEIVQEITGTPCESVMEVVVSVDTNMLNKILVENTTKVKTMEHASMDMDAIERRRRIVERVKTSSMYKREGILESFIVTSNLFGAEPDELLDAYILVTDRNPDKFPAIDKLSVPDLAAFVYQLVCASGVSTPSVLGAAKLMVGDLLDDSRLMDKQKIAYMLDRCPIPGVEV